MLEKIQGVVRSNKLRIIQLLQADLNQVLRIALTRKTTRLAKTHEGGSVSTSTDTRIRHVFTPVLNKLITIQLLIQKKTHGIVFDNDAKGCYNRIVSGILIATLRRLGYSKESVRMLGLLWSQMQHHICTGFGVSETTYGSTIEKILYGIGQGSCASPILWALLNQLILVAPEEKFDCIRLVAIDGVEEHVRPGDSFVDDTTCGVTYDDITAEPVSSAVLELVEREEELIEHMEAIMQYFLDLLQVIGGDLAPEKCAWFLIVFWCKDDKAKMVQIKQSHKGINLTSKSEGTTVGIKRKAPSDNNRTLGFHLQGDGKTDSHKKVMREKAEAYGEVISGSLLQRGESSAVYNCYYMPSIGYGTPATTVSFKECDDLQKPIVNAILPKMGITSKAPRAVVFRTTRYGGIGLDYLAVVQSHGQLQYLLGHLRCKDNTGQLIRMVMEFTQIVCGCTDNVFEKSYKKYAGAIIDENWIMVIWSHLERCEATVKITGMWKPTHGRENDNAIMETITASGRFRPVEMREINRCRLYLQVFLTSDIPDNRGKHLEPWVLKGQRQSTRKSICEWPVHQIPTARKAWKQAIT
jgi:hypothetical protein